MKGKIWGVGFCQELKGFWNRPLVHSFSHPANFHLTTPPYKPPIYALFQPTTPIPRPLLLSTNPFFVPTIDPPTRNALLTHHLHSPIFQPCSTYLTPPHLCSLYLSFSLILSPSKLHFLAVLFSPYSLAAYPFLIYYHPLPTPTFPFTFTTFFLYI